MSTLARIAVAFGSLVAAAPLFAWLWNPTVVCLHPLEDPTGLLGLVYAVLGSFGEGTRVPGNGVLWFYTVFVVAGFEAVGLALLLTIRGWTRPGVPLLALFLVGAALYFDVLLLAIPHGLPNWLAEGLGGSGAWIGNVLLPLGLGLSLAALVKFSASFPRPLSAEMIARYSLSAPKSTADRYAEASSRLLHRVGGRRLVREVPTPEETAHARSRLFTQWIDRGWIWLAFPAAATGPYLLQQALPDIRTALAIVYIPLLGLSALFFSNTLFAVGRNGASPMQLRQITWVSAGLRGALWLWVVFGVLAYVLALALNEVGTVVYMASLFAFGPLLMAAAVVTALAAAVLLGGAVDPSLAIRRTTVYATLLLCFAFMFALVEEWFANVLVGRVGVSDRTASLLLGATVGVALAPLKAVIDRLVTRMLSLPNEGKGGEGSGSA